MTYSYSNGVHSFEADSLEDLIALIQATRPDFIHPSRVFIDNTPAPADSPRPLLGTKVSGTVKELYDMGVRVADDESDDHLARIHLYESYAYTWEPRDQEYNPTRASGQYPTPHSHFTRVHVIEVQDGNTFVQTVS